MSEPRWATLLEAAHRMEAEIVKEALEAQGFPAEIFQEGVMHYGYTGGRIEVCVPDNRLEDARAWLAAYEEGQLVEGSDEALPDLDDVEESEDEEDDE